MSIKNILDNRTITSLGLSIGTGLALESIFIDQIETIFDSDRKFDKIDINKYKIHYFNIYVLVRNIVTSIPTINVNTLMASNDKVKFITEVLDNEIEILDELYSNVDTKIILWIPDYAGVQINLLKKEYIGNLSKKDEIFLLVHDVIEKIRKSIRNKTFPIDAYSNKHTLPPSNESVLLTSYFALDLLNVKKNPKMDLLESHTGKLVTKEHFNKKYHAVGKQDLTRLPFTEFLLYILGDNTLVKIEKLGSRKEVIEISEKNRWNIYTSPTKVKYDLLKIESIRGRVNNFKEMY